MLLLERYTPIKARYQAPPSLELGLTHRPRHVPLDAGDLANEYFFDFERAAEARDGTFRFLARTHWMGPGIDWTGIDQPKLWTYNLHYFNYFKDLAIAYRMTGDQ